MIINLDPFHHNNYNEVSTPQRFDNGDESLNESRESNDEPPKLDLYGVKEEDDFDSTVSNLEKKLYRFSGCRNIDCKNCSVRFTDPRRARQSGELHDGSCERPKYEIDRSETV